MPAVCLLADISWRIRNKKLAGMQSCLPCIRGFASLMTAYLPPDVKASIFYAYVIDRTEAASMRPWMFGPFAVYARHPHIARQVYETVRDMDEDLEPFGTVTLDCGETVYWVYLGTRLERFPSQHGTMKR